MRLTKRHIDALKPSAKDTFAWDSELRGFGVRVKPSGKKTYIVQYRTEQGRSRRLALGPHGVLTPDKARDLAIIRLAEVKHGKDPAAIRRATRHALKVNGLCDRYLKEHAEPHKKPSSAKEDKRLIENRIRPALGTVSVESVTRADILKLQHNLRETPYEANRVIALLSKAFNLAEAWGLRPDGTNPTRHVKRFPEKKRERFLDRDELSRLGTALRDMERSGEVRPIPIAGLRLLLLTGCRVSEVLAFEWRSINWEAGTIRLSDSKTGPKTVHLGVAALDVLSKIKRQGEHVLTAILSPEERLSLHTLEKTWSLIRERANLDGFRLHDLRHTYASWAVMGGHSLPITGALLGHSEPQTTQRYAHLANERLHTAANDITATLALALKTSNFS
ncbi:MAG: tyrosine-type recombinase/integrase [Rhizomicrobium sp.]